MGGLRRARYSSRGGTWTKQWSALSRATEPPQVTRAKNEALQQCTFEFDHNLRHRVLAKHQRVLASPYGGGAFDTSFPVIRVDSEHKSQIQLSELPAHTPARAQSGMIYVAAESQEHFEKARTRLNLLTNPIIDQDKGRRGVLKGSSPEHLPLFEVQPQPHSGMNRRWGTVFRVDPARLNYSTRASLNSVIFTGDDVVWRRLSLPTRQDKSKEAPDRAWGMVVGMRHQNILEVHRLPVKAQRPPLPPGARLRRGKDGRLQCRRRRRRRVHLGSLSLEKQISRMVARVRRFGFFNYYCLPKDRPNMIPTHLAAAALTGSYSDAVEKYLLFVCVHRPKLWARFQAGSFHRPFFATSLRGNPRRYNALTMFEMVNKKRRGEIEVFKGELSWRSIYNEIPPSDRKAAHDMVREHIFNYMLSMRVSLYGTDVVAGDLVFSPGGSGGVTHVTEDTVAQYTIYDVVLPVFTLPFDTADYIVPSHKVGLAMVEEVLSDFGISMSQLNHTNNAWNDLAVLAAPSEHQEKYRYILVRPQRVTWQVVRSEEVEEEVRSAVANDEGGVSTSTTKTTKHFTERLDLGSLPLPATRPPPTPAPKVVVTADLPLTSNMHSLLREVFFSSTFRGFPALWQVGSIRPGATITADPVTESIYPSVDEAG